jgi:CSLREA domain-containing protein
MRTVQGLGAVAIAAATLAMAAGAEAKTFEVTRTNDPSPGNCKPNDCSLREAVLAANDRAGADKVVLPGAGERYRLQTPNSDPLAGEDAALEGDLDVTGGRLTVSHPGRGRATIDANGLDRVFGGFVGGPLTIKRLKLTGGDTSAGNDGGGGAIQSSAGVTIVRSVLTRNLAGNVGGAIDMNDEGDLRIVRSALVRNEALNTAGAIRSGAGAITILGSRLDRNVAAGDGGAIRLSSAESVRISKSTISGNRTGGQGGGIQNDGEQPLRITDSTISGNFAEDDGGGIQVGTDASPARITNSTIAGNRSLAFGGGIYAEGDGLVTLNAVTIARNAAAAEDVGKPAAIGGGIYHGSNSAFSVRNTILALNTVGAVGMENDCGFAIVPPLSLGNNLLSTDGPVGICEGFYGPTDRIRANPKIGKLARNGGPTKTIALKQGSPAIGLAHKPSAPNRDQRGRKRDGNPDAGAFERGA